VKSKLKSKYSEKDRDQAQHEKWQKKVDKRHEAERAASNGHMKTVYEVTRVLCNERRSTGNVVKDKHGRVLSSQLRKERTGGKNTFRRYLIAHNLHIH
jgi:hypothetical protein